MFKHITDAKTALKAFNDIISSELKRPGYGLLLDFIEETDFKTAPASTKYHGSNKGGLLMHSVGVYYALKDLAKLFDYEEKETGEFAICGLFHDLCKADTYKATYKNVKTYEINDSIPKDIIKYDPVLRKEYAWISQPTYTFDEQFTFGHGEKSVYLLQRFIPVYPLEAQAIRYHMGAFRAEDINSVGKVYESNKLAWLLHVADEYDTYWLK